MSAPTDINHVQQVASLTQQYKLLEIECMALNHSLMDGLRKTHELRVQCLQLGQQVNEANQENAQLKKQLEELQEKYPVSIPDNLPKEKKHA